MKKKVRGKASKRSFDSTWSSLTWTDLDDWAGSRAVSRGRSYQRRGAVHDLSISSEGELVAWVAGGARYATRVRCEPPRKGGRRQGRLRSSCSCPVGVACKHAVAAVVDALERLESEEEVPQAAADDVRWDLADGTLDPAGFEEASEPADLEPYLRSLAKTQLVELLLECIAHSPEVQADLVRRRALSKGDVAVIVRQVRAEIAAASAEEAWSNSWSGAGNIPDYSRVQSGFESLLDGGHADAVVGLGEELFRAGQEQVERSHDDGETGMAIAECLVHVFRALLQSSLSDAEKILYAIDMSLADGYGLAGDAENIVDRKWGKRTWSRVADSLSQRLASTGGGSGADFRSSYHRERVSNWLVLALDAAGRRREATQLCEREAQQAGNYERLVRRLIDEKRLDEAVEWSKRGYAAVLGEHPGTAARLLECLKDIARRRRQWPLVAAYEAERFFGRPDVPRLMDLLAAAKKAGSEAEVRKVALRFLETGKRPARPRWPLPATRLPRLPDVVGGRASSPSRHWGVLRDLAIDEDRPDDVLRWHDRLSQCARPRARGTGDADLRVARAVSSTHPERAIEIYRAAAERLIEQAKPDAYVQAGALLQRVKDLLDASDRSREWSEILDGVRESHRRKRRLVEVLDGLEGQPIVRRKKKARSRKSGGE